MVSFVESATLLLQDKSTPQIKKINKELTALFNTVKKLKNSRISVDVSARGLTKANTDMNRLLVTARKANRAKAHLTVTSQGITQAEQRLKALTKPRTVRLNVLTNGMPAGGIGGAGGPGGGVGIGGGAGGRPRGGATLTHDFFNAWKTQALHTLAYRIQHAIARGFADAATNQDIADLQVLSRLTKNQQDLLAQSETRRTTGDADSRAVFTRADRAQIITDIVPQIEGTDADRISGANAMFDVLSDLKRQMASTGNFTEDGFAELSRAIQGGAGDLIEDGKVSKEARRVIDSLSMASLAMGEAFDPGLIKRSLAFAKTAGRTMDSESLAAMFQIVGDKGQRAANAMNSMIDNLSGSNPKKMNAVLEKMGLREDGKTVDADVLRTSPMRWLEKHLIPAMNRQVGEDASIAQRAEFLSSIIGRKVSQDMAIEIIEGMGPLKAFFEQYKNLDFTDPTAVEDRLSTSFTAALEQASIRLADVFGTISQKAEGPFIGALDRASKSLQAVDAILRGAPIPDGAGIAARDLAVGAGAAGLGGMLAGKLLKFLNPLNGAATALTGSAGHLSRAAAALTGAAGRPGAGGIGGGIGDGSGRGSKGGKGGNLGASSGRSWLRGFGLLAAAGLVADAASDFTSFEGMSADEKAAAVNKSAQDRFEAEKALNARIESYLPEWLTKHFAQPKEPKKVSPSDFGGSNMSKEDTLMTMPVTGTVADQQTQLIGSNQELSSQVAALTVAIAQGTREGADTRNLEAEKASTQKLIADSISQSQNMQTPAQQELSSHIQSVKNDIASLTSQMVTNKKNEKIDGTSDIVNFPLEQQRQILQNELSQLQVEASNLGIVFDTGSAQLGGVFQQGVSSLDQAAASFGPTAGQGIVPFGTAFGQAAGQAIAAQVAAIKVDVNNTPRVDTGAQNP